MNVVIANVKGYKLQAFVGNNVGDKHIDGNSKARNLIKVKECKKQSRYKKNTQKIVYKTCAKHNYSERCKVKFRAVYCIIYGKDVCKTSE